MAKIPTTLRPLPPLPTETSGTDTKSAKLKHKTTPDGAQNVWDKKYNEADPTTSKWNLRLESSEKNGISHDIAPNGDLYARVDRSQIKKNAPELYLGEALSTPEAATSKAKNLKVSFSDAPEIKSILVNKLHGTFSLVKNQIDKFLNLKPELKATSENLAMRAETYVQPTLAPLIQATSNLHNETAETDNFGKVDVSAFRELAKQRTNDIMSDFTQRCAAFPDDVKGNSKESKKLNKNLIEALSQTFKEVYPEASKAERSAFKADAAQLLSNLITETLNKSETNWKPFSNEITINTSLQSDLGVSNPTHDLTFKSDFKPASSMPVFKEAYEANKIQGISSLATKECRHAMNLWVSDFQGPLSSFSQVRHGVNSPFGEKNSDLRTQGADVRTKEVITAVASTKQKEIEAWVLKNPGKPFPLNIASTSHLTPSLKAKSYEDDQQAAWDRAQDPDTGLNSINVSFSDGTIQSVPIELKVLAFSFGVNGFAKLDFLAGPIGKVIGANITGWKWADTHNEPLFDELKDLARNARGSLNAGGYIDMDKADRIDDYIRQLDEALAAGNQRRTAKNAYGVSVLTTLIANEAGLGLASNCMSNKDRNGYKEAALKAHLMHRDCLNTQDNESFTPEEYGDRNEARNALLTLATEIGGGKEIQKACTGVAGYKVGEGGVFKVQANLDNVFDSNQLLGLSGAVRA